MNRIFLLGKFRREFRNVLERGHCLTLKHHQRHNQWQSQYRSRYANDDQEHSFIHSTTHMIHVTPSLKKHYGCSVSNENNCQIKSNSNSCFLSTNPSKRVRHRSLLMATQSSEEKLEILFKITSRQFHQ